MRNRLFTIALLALGAIVASAGQNPVQAQYGFSVVPVGGRGTCYAPPRHHYNRYAVPYGSYRVPYGYRSSLYVRPGLTVTKSRQYISPLPRYSLGYRGFGYGYSPGFAPRPIPRMRLSLGF